VLAKAKDITLIIVSHVTKDGQIAGPKVLEHMVDTVLYFEGERGHQFRILRAIKNRYGAAGEIGVFEMNDNGLNEVSNPSELFLSTRQKNISGAAVFGGMEGTRPVLVEVQALIAPSFMPTPRRAVVGWDLNRLSMVIAVLASRFGLNLSNKEVYLNVAGGLRINEPAADLAIILALISATKDMPLPESTMVVGEVALSGEVRMVSNIDMRLKEAVKLGFQNLVIPKDIEKLKSWESLRKTLGNVKIHPISHIRDLARFFSK
ncbi:MAG: DNA repair protein RadA, partial [Proteobacteria bacterium]|nr:DNA repair protein RadA [Pseudomonadota bacterium]